MADDLMSESGLSSHPLLAVRDIHKYFGYKQVLKGVSLDLQPAEACLLMGRNGAGKSTLVRILTGLMRPSKGELQFKGSALEDVPSEYRRAFGMITHQSLFYDDLTARENLLFFGKLRKINDLKTRVEQALLNTGLEKATDVQVKAFSSGMNKRLNIARIMISDPELLFLDEPYSGLDLDSIDLLNRYLESFIRQKGSLLLISHQLECCFHICKTACMLVNGKISKKISTSGLQQEQLIEQFQNQQDP